MPVSSSRPEDRPAELIELTKQRRASSASQDEREDVVRAAAGDVEAFERLYRAHVARIHGLCRRMLGEADADDAAQEVFVRAWRKLATFRGGSAFGTWLYRLAINAVLSRSGARMRRERHHASVDIDALPATGRRDRSDLRLDIEAALQTLPIGARQVFVLHDIEGYTHEEIGELLSVNTGTSKSQLHRARMALRAYLNQ